MTVQYWRFRVNKDPVDFAAEDISFAPI